MTKKRVFILFIFVVIIQLCVPLSMIARREITLHSGAQLKFKVAPVDPYDAFRGRYVNIRLQSEGIPVADDMELRYNQKIYVVLEQNDQGFAQMTQISLEPPKDEQQYFKTTVLYTRNEGETDGKKLVYVDIPFDRYYMEESLAPQAEKVYRRHAEDAYVTIRFLSGFGVIEQLYMNEMPIEQFLKHYK